MSGLPEDQTESAGNGATESEQQPSTTGRVNAESLHRPRPAARGGARGRSGVSGAIALEEGSIVSSTLMALPVERRPDPPTVCEACPAAVWMETVEGEVSNYCRIMHTVMWRTSAQNSLANCDGLAIAIEQTRVQATS